jgi:dihydroorotate dehydrogenase electron transfer subunit
MKILNSIPKTVKVKEVRVESELVKTFVLDVSLGARPGQFVNVWIPRLDEKPISVAMDDGKEMWLTIAAVGAFSEAMHGLKAGDTVGIRGPLGTEFEIEDGKHYALLAGGYGAAPLYFFAVEAAKRGCEIDFIIGARNKDLLLYVERAGALDGVSVHTATDDGSDGHEGFNTEILSGILEKGGVDCICTCGPEVMMVKAAEMAQEKKIDAQISVERYMKCGLGVCGNCVVDGLGEPTCTAGPVMPLEKVLQIEDFGKYHRDSLGKKHNF